MSWMIKGGSSSGSEQSPLDCPLSERAQRGFATTKDDFASAAGWDSVIDRWRRSPVDNSTKSIKSWRASEGVGAPPYEGVHPLEGFG
jgi:hypothetical protein